ncbi:MAG: DUF4446 family protein [Minisyncoccia bacterium]
MTINPEMFSLLALGITLISLVFTVLIYVRVSKFFRAGSGISFENTANKVLDDLSQLQKFQKELTEYINILEKRVKRSTQIAFSKRYNPFKGTGEGGLQSHSTALLSEEGNGVMLSTLTTRDRVSVFAKPIKNFISSEVELTPEERDIVDEAKKFIS